MDATRILEGLNEAQRAAVTSPASVLQVLAPPGSGKTKTLTSRVAYLIAHHGLDPRNIIVCTFTNKAAKEMQDRVSGFLGKEVAKKLILGTFHSISRRFLSAYGKYIDLDEKFGIADSGDQKAIIGRIVKRLKLQVETNYSRTVQSRISSCKSKGQTIEQWLSSSKANDKYEFAEIWGEYEEELRVQNMLDFDDLLLKCCELLRSNPQCVGGIGAVLVDEFQDTNNIQYELMELFSQRRQAICIVGDPDQSIYGWRNAEIKNLKKMRERWPDTHVEILSENYRTSGAILQAAQEVIEQDETRENKRLMPTHSIGMPAVLRRLPTAEIEARWVVFEIKRTAMLMGGMLNFDDYAILLRSAALSRQIESALGKEGIPYKMVGGQKFFDRIEVKLVLDYLRVISHPEHNDAVLRIINVPKRGVGDKTLEGLVAEAKEKKIPLWDMVKGVAQGRRRSPVNLTKPAQTGLNQFVNLILTAQKRLRSPPEDQDTLLDFLKTLIEKVGVAKYLQEKDSEDYETRIANVQELVQQASEFANALQNGDFDEEALVQTLEENVMDLTDVAEEADGLLQDLDTVKAGSTEETLIKFLGNVALATDAQKSQDDGPPKPTVTISTIHAAKGLEWPVVFIPASYNGSIPHSRAEDQDEERRLLYVAMTRAQSLLYLSCPVKDQSKNDVTLSPFLSKEGMDGYLVKSGVKIGFDVIKEISIILRRPCPEHTIVRDALATCEYPQDNKWPESGIIDQEEHKDWGMLGADIDHNYTNRSFKRPRIGQEASFERKVALPGFSFATTMDKQGSFSSVTTTMPTAGFVSAKDVKIEEPPQRKTSATQKGEPAAVPKKKQKELPVGQGNLLSFFAKPKSQPPSRENSLDSSNTSEPLSISSRPPAQLHKVSSNLSTTSVDTIVNRSTTSIDATKENRPNPEESSIKERSVPEMRPASTFHTTSVQGVVSSDRLRRTLGARPRVMNGWAQRMNR